MAVTAVYGWTKPTVGASTNTWGTELNATLDDIDTDLDAAADVAAAALPKAGGTMTGPIVLSGAPTLDLHPATKLYADAMLPKAGGTMTGPLVAVQASTAPVADSSSAGAITINCQDSNVFKVAMTENITSMTLSNPADGQTINIRFTQDATGGRTITWPASFKWAGASAALLSTAASAVDLLVATYWSDTGHWHASLLKGLA